MVEGVPSLTCSEIVLMVLLFAYTMKVSKRKIKDFAKLTDDKELFLHIQHHFAFSFLSLEVIRNIFSVQIGRFLSVNISIQGLSVNTRGGFRLPWAKKGGLH